MRGGSGDEHEAATVRMLHGWLVGLRRVGWWCSGRVRGQKDEHPPMSRLHVGGTVLALRSQCAALSTVAAAQTRESSGFQVARLPPGLPTTAPRTRATDPISDR